MCVTPAGTSTSLTSKINGMSDKHMQPNNAKLDFSNCSGILWMDEQSQTSISTTHDCLQLRKSRRGWSTDRVLEDLHKDSVQFRLYIVTYFSRSADHERDWPPCEFFRVGNQYPECSNQQHRGTTYRIGNHVYYWVWLRPDRLM